MEQRSVGVAELKNGLSSYLTRVKQGEEIVICERGLPVAMLAPLRGAARFDAEEAALVSAGILTLPQEPIPESLFKQTGKGKLTARKAAQVVIKNRDEERY